MRETVNEEREASERDKAAVKLRLVSQGRRAGSNWLFRRGREDASREERERERERERREGERSALQHPNVRLSLLAASTASTTPSVTAHSILHLVRGEKMEKSRAREEIGRAFLGVMERRRKSE